MVGVGGGQLQLVDSHFHCEEALHGEEEEMLDCVAMIHLHGEEEVVAHAELVQLLLAYP